MNKLHKVEWDDEKPPNYALLISTKIDGGWGGPWWTFDAQVVRIDDEDGKPRNLDDKRQPMAWLFVSASMSSGHGDGQPYGMQVVFKPAGSVDLQSAERMASVLKTVERGLDRLGDRFGYLVDLPTLVTRFMDVCGIGSAILQVTRGADGYYTSGTYRSVARRSVASEVADLIEDGQKRLGVIAA